MESKKSKDRSIYNKDATPFIPSRKLSLPTYLETNDSDSSSNNSPIPKISSLNNNMAHSIEGSMSPGGFGFNNYLPYQQYPVPQTTFLVTINNLPCEIDSVELSNFIKEVDEEFTFKIVNLQKSAYQELEDVIEIASALIEVYEYNQMSSLIENLDGYEWMERILEVKFLPYFVPYFVPYPPMGGALNPMMKDETIYPYSHPLSRNSSISSSNSNPSTPYSTSMNSDSNFNSTSNLNSSNSSTGVPQFLMNFVSSNKEDSDFIVTKNDQGQNIKVNPCRLFVGNIPFSSTWSNLKKFLIEKCNEFEPNNDIEILRVEIPMNNNLNVKKYQILTSFIRDQTSTPDDLHLNDEEYVIEKNMSRGFAIVTTGNKTSSEKIIKYFDGVEFEGRELTVRFDKFPDFNNYMLQQLYPHQKEKTLANLAFERNSFQQKFYYGNYINQNFNHNMHTGSNSYSYYKQPQYHNRSQSVSYHRHQSPRLPVLQPNFTPQIHPSAHYTNNNMPRSTKKKSKESVMDIVDEDERARELVNSFESLGISS
ncbi:hypothetical protein CLIB1444_02S06194 [[Candida] jaroonii]|uniref:Uncharacterized protein n=1 Tax=[Candida] jaroonii TaxID=467808 RepID=A0ACA9Y352_9ASCO|nr:hypothetical protein CLIB1444_02S06194 [[Candida] jaroonii]